MALPDANAVRQLAKSPHPRDLKLSVLKWDGLSGFTVPIDLEAPAEVEGTVPERLRSLLCRGRLDESSARRLAAVPGLSSTSQSAARCLARASRAV